MRLLKKDESGSGQRRTLRRWRERFFFFLSFRLYSPSGWCEWGRGERQVRLDVWKVGRSWMQRGIGYFRRMLASKTDKRHFFLVGIALAANRRRRSGTVWRRRKTLWFLPFLFRFQPGPGQSRHLSSVTLGTWSRIHWKNQMFSSALWRRR